MKHTLSSVLLLVLAAPTFPGHEAAAAAAAGPVKVEIRRSEGDLRLYRDGQPYHIKGAVYWGDPTGKLPLKDIVNRGGNSVAHRRRRAEDP